VATHQDISALFCRTCSEAIPEARQGVRLRHAASRPVAPPVCRLRRWALGLPDWGTSQILKPGVTVRLALGGFAPKSLVQMRIYGNPHTAPSGQSVVDYITSASTKSLNQPG
jgi:hypothetical protein